MNDRIKGIVKWFSRAKGYGFIAPEGGTADVFVHYSAIVGQGIRKLVQGQRVEFRIADSPQGLAALDVEGQDS